MSGSPPPSGYRATNGVRAARIAPPLIVLALAVTIVEIYVRVAHISTYILPLPSTVARSLWIARADLFSALGWTTLAALIGFFASTVVGILLAMALSASTLVRRAFYPYTVFFQTVPIIAIAPMLVVWVGFGLLPVEICAFIVSVFPVIANTLAGLLATDVALIELFSLYGAGPIAAMWKLRLPSALPSIFTGLRIAAGLSVIGTVVAEFTVGQTIGRAGLGVMIVDGAKQGRLDLAFAAVFLASMLGLAMLAGINLLSRIMLRHWHASGS